MTHLVSGIAGLSMTELLMVLLVVVLLFGSTKIPQLMRGLGQGINEFKKGMKEGAPDENAPKDGAPKDVPPQK